jgi:ribose transport system substrate-binding protein
MPKWYAAAKAGEVKTVVFDTLDFQLDFVRVGMVQGLIGQKYFGWGYDTVQMLFDKVVNDKTFNKDWTDSGIDVVCPNNWQEMRAMWSSNDFTQDLSDCSLSP